MKLSVSKEKHATTHLLALAMAAWQRSYSGWSCSRSKECPGSKAFPSSPPKNLPVYHWIRQYRIICEETRDWEEGEKETNKRFQGHPKGMHLFSFFCFLLLVQTLNVLVLPPHPANHPQRKDSHPEESEPDQCSVELHALTGALSCCKQQGDSYQAVDKKSTLMRLLKKETQFHFGVMMTTTRITVLLGMKGYIFFNWSQLYVGVEMVWFPGGPTFFGGGVRTTLVPFWLEFSHVKNSTRNLHPM